MARRKAEEVQEEQAGAEGTAEAPKDDSIRVSSGKAKAGKRTEQGDGFTDSVTVTRNFGDSLSDAVARFGEDVVFNLFGAQATIRCQAVVRSKMEETNEQGQFVNNDEACVQAGLDFVPQAQTRKSRGPNKAQLILEALQAGMSADEVLAKYGAS